MTTTQDLEMSITVNNSPIQATLVPTIMLNLLLNLRCVQTFTVLHIVLVTFCQLKNKARGHRITRLKQTSLSLWVEVINNKNINLRF